MINIRNDTVYYEECYYKVGNLKSSLFNFIHDLVSKNLYDHPIFKYDEIESIIVYKSVRIISTDEGVSPDLLDIEYNIGLLNVNHMELNNSYDKCPPRYILDTRTIYHIDKKDIKDMVQNGIDTILPSMVRGIFSEHTWYSEAYEN